MPARAILVSAFVAALAASAFAQDSPNRREIRRADLSGAPGMEVIMSVAEYRPGDELTRHFHHGIEAGYVLEGGMIQAPGRESMELKTGESIFILRDVPHGGFRIVGERSVKLLTVHVVDKGKPLYDAPK